MLTSMPSPTVELHAKDSVAFSLDNLGASASKLWHVIIPVCPFNSVAVEHVTFWVALIQHLFLEYTSWTVLEAAHGFIWNHTVAALPRHSCLEEKQNKKKRFLSPRSENKDGGWCIYPLFLAKTSVRKATYFWEICPCADNVEYARFESFRISPLHVVVSVV